MNPKHTIKLYGRPNCCLCQEAEEAIRQVIDGKSVDFEVIDITGDNRLEAEYGELIPVTTLNGEVVSYGQISHLRLRRLLGGGSLSERYRAFLRSFPARFRS